LIAEHKSKGESLDSAYSQAIDYLPGVSERDLPRYIIVSNFAKFRINDLENDTQAEFSLEELHEHIHYLGFIAGYESRSYDEQDPINIEVAQKLTQLHNKLNNFGYQGHDLKVYLVRILFCMFAEDTGIFLPRGSFQDFIEQRTSEDGSDLGLQLAQLFEVLNTRPKKRQATLDEQLQKFPYVDGSLFSERLRIAAFNRDLRTLLLDCCNLDWGQVNPAIFGNLFQSIIDGIDRRQLGAHYTSEDNIHKLIYPLFLSELKEQFQKIRQDKSTQRDSKLKRFHNYIASLNFLDPACGCGNFLVIAYKELRLLELEVIRELYLDEETQQLSIDAVEEYVKVNVDQFHGIEIQEWPVQIARVAMWLIDHQLNIAISKEFGQTYARIPLVKSANIINSNAVQIDWENVLPAKNCSFILGNPPFSGGKTRSEQQRKDHDLVHQETPRSGLLDYVTCWYVKAANYMRLNPNIEAGFVSTNSISQGEQAGILWSHLYSKCIRINFAHRSFRWQSEATRSAAVHCVIVGFALYDIEIKQLFEYENEQGNPLEKRVKSINPYLVNGPETTLERRKKPICNVPLIGIGNKPIDGGNYLFTDEEMQNFVSE
jgi:type II restriction/modification system DNA methylase subunit YeeA